MDMLSVSASTVTTMSMEQLLLLALFWLIIAILFTPGLLDLLVHSSKEESVKKPVKNTLTPLESIKEQSVKLPPSSREE
jgi:hypothetical protein